MDGQIDREGRQIASTLWTLSSCVPEERPLLPHLTFPIPEREAVINGHYRDSVTALRNLASPMGQLSDALPGGRWALQGLGPPTGDTH